MNQNIGLLTYHAAHNFGSMLQAYALQNFLQNSGYKVTIINYRLPEQKEFYQLYRVKYGYKAFIKDLLKIPYHRERRLGSDRFEKFIVDYLNCGHEVISYKEAIDESSHYDILISGSDQLWNKHSCELERSKWENMWPYLLKGFRGNTVSYASSIGNMSEDELTIILPLINQIKHVSLRENEAANKVSLLLNKPIATVLDPTFLLTKDAWVNNLNLHKMEEPFALYYSLRSRRDQINIYPYLRNIGEKNNLKIITITPYVNCFKKDEVICPIFDFGPIEFLNALYNSKYVITDSYHGTILSVNFNKNFYSICNKGNADYRKTDALEKIELTSRAIKNLEDIDVTLPKIDYRSINERISDLRQSSIAFIMDSLSDD